MLRKLNHIILFSLTAVIGFSGCKKIFDLPEQRDYLSPRADFGQKILGAENSFVLGRTSMTQTDNFNADFSSFPIKFEIANMRLGDGTPTDDVLQEQLTKVWTKPYTGLETSLEEIEAKRKEEMRPMFEIRPSGQFVLWNTSNSKLIQNVVDNEEYLAPQRRRFFDVKMSNSGGERIIRNFQLNVFRERPYEPSRDVDPYTAKSTGEYNHPSVNGIRGVLSKNYLSNNDVRVYFKKVGEGNTLTFRFFNADSSVIDPNSFNLMTEEKWRQLVHGFNMDKTNAYVRYQVAYPIPLATLPTPYTNGGILGGGEEASVVFQFARNIGPIREPGSLGFNFRIYEEGDWEIAFHFKTDSPNFANE